MQNDDNCPQKDSGYEKQRSKADPFPTFPLGPQNERSDGGSSIEQGRVTYASEYTFTVCAYQVCSWMRKDIINPKVTDAAS